MPKENIITLATLGIGEGNKLSIQSAQRELSIAGVFNHSTVIKSPLTYMASRKQRKVTNKEEARHTYNQKYEKIRNGWPAKVLGLVSLMQLCAFLHETRANKLVLAQELPLSILADLELPLASAIIRQLDEIIILVPDVHAKPNALAAVKKLQAKKIPVKLGVWNSKALQQLEQAEIASYYLKPWLLGELPKLPQNQAPMAVTRPSGTGVNKDYITALANLLKKINPNVIGQQVFSSQDLSQYDKKSKQTATHKNHFSSLDDMLVKMFSYNPELIFSYPSEMIQVLVQFYLAGWQGKHYSFPERGLHEVSNLDFAISLGLSQRLMFNKGIFRIDGESKAINLEEIKSLIGNQSLVQALNIK